MEMVRMAWGLSGDATGKPEDANQPWTGALAIRIGWTGDGAGAFI